MATRPPSMLPQNGDFMCITCRRGPPYTKKYAKNQCQTCYKKTKKRNEGPIGAYCSTGHSDDIQYHGNQASSFYRGGAEWSQHYQSSGANGYYRPYPGHRGADKEGKMDSHKETASHE